MMKILTALFIVFVASVVLFAVPMQGDGQGQNDSQGNGQDMGQGVTVQNESMVQNQGENQTLQENQTIQTQEMEQNQSQENASVQVQERENLRSQANQLIQQKKDELKEELKQVRAEVKSVYENQNRVRLAVHVLLNIENLTGGIGKNVSAIAREFNNSVQATLNAEERIQTRNSIMRFLFGGDESAAANLTAEVAQNQLRVQELNQLRNQCDCDNETKAMMQEQIQEMEQEQTRLQELAQNESKSKGLLGWLFK
jgi:hypothetical protein